MRTIEISGRNWEEFCRLVDRVCHAGLISINLIDQQGGSKTVMHDLRMQSMSFDNKTDQCNTRIIIEVGLPGEKPLVHTVVEPIHIRLKNVRGGDRYHQLQIVAENGTAVIELHPGLLAAELTALEADVAHVGENMTL